MIATDVFDEVVVCALAVLCIDGSAVGDLERGSEAALDARLVVKERVCGKVDGDARALLRACECFERASLKELDVADPFLRLVALWPGSSGA